MPTVTLIFTDTPEEEGGVLMEIKNDTTVKENEAFSPAQTIAVIAMRSAMRVSDRTPQLIDPDSYEPVVPMDPSGLIGNI